MTFIVIYCNSHSTLLLVHTVPNLFLFVWKCICRVSLCVGVHVHMCVHMEARIQLQFCL